MNYKTICHQMIQDRPEMYEQLCQSRTLLETVNRYATQLRDSHMLWKEWLLQKNPGSSESQCSSEAMEVALKDLEDSLPPLAPGEGFSLDVGMAYLPTHTPPA